MRLSETIVPGLEVSFDRVKGDGFDLIVGGSLKVHNKRAQLFVPVAKGHPLELVKLCTKL